MNLMKCPNCKQEVPESLNFCTHCGAKLNLQKESGTNIRSIGKTIRGMSVIVLFFGALICGLGLIISFFVALDDESVWPIVIAFLIGVPVSIITGLVLDGFGQLIENVRLMAEKIATMDIATTDKTKETK